ncbi:MAG TPA: HlyD family efflux transporter periplasmic adaptor subunit [Bryobacteraceae bacterium]|jgi:HlyD family secretion protein|nr:HlyD family efflux transporter periplasmic adaptor subunit [Bryobacteraceae bacterium]
MSALSSPATAPSRPPQRPRPAAAPGRPRRRRIGAGFVALLLIAGGVAAYRAITRTRQAESPLAAIRTAKVFSGPLEVTLRMSGQTSARNFANVTAPLLRGPEMRGSLVLMRLAKPGAMVHKGDLIAQLDAQSLEDHIDDLKDTVQQAANDVWKREAEQKVEWEDMQQTLRVAKSELDKAKLDYSAGEVKTEIERELLKLAMDEAQARYNEQLKDVALRKASQESELKILKLTLERHSRHLARHTRDLEKFTMYATMDGLAVMANIFRGGEMAQVQLGDQVWPGQQIMKIVDTRSMQVEGSVSQSDSSGLRLGQRVRIGLDAFPNKTLTGRIYSIGALAVGGWRQNYYIRNVPVRVAIEGSDPTLIPDLSAHADIILETVPDQLQIPIAAVKEENGRAAVLVKSATGWERRLVTLGKRNNVYVAVASGLAAGEEVRLN